MVTSTAGFEVKHTSVLATVVGDSISTVLWVLVSNLIDFVLTEKTTPMYFPGCNVRKTKVYIVSY